MHWSDDGIVLSARPHGESSAVVQLLTRHQGRHAGLLREAAQRDMEEFLGRKVHLFLFVKVRENWLEDPARYRAMNLEFDV